MRFFCNISLLINLIVLFMFIKEIVHIHSIRHRRWVSRHLQCIKSINWRLTDSKCFFLANSTFWNIRLQLWRADQISEVDPSIWYFTEFFVIEFRTFDSQILAKNSHNINEEFRPIHKVGRADFTSVCFFFFFFCKRPTIIFGTVKIPPPNK